ncbi:hypothetical protein [Cellvibrio polysaccharolyticus]|uniref:Uncharacterized protein n=1 Tax=Cellvibrio polysaccharolyticus TaxID=2082724 RepID=A0A928V3I1_9GAMM|nr:hypothetical protein [Cellvibrio polysaccharolyticus]MBE8715959.1 hypothetical protein [Cellvibrio polysaccharolyticus]
MVVLVLGFFVLICGLLMMRNPELDRLLKKNDEAEWATVMRPSLSGYVNSFGIIPLFTWVLAHGYEKSASEQVRTVGSASLKRAMRAKYCMLVGVVLIATGFLLALFL